MRVLTVLVAILFLGTAASTSVDAPSIVPGADPVLRADPDGGHTVVALLEDGVGGSYRRVPVSDAGIAAFTDQAAANGVFVDPVVYSANLQEVGAFAHAFELDGTPFLTLGTYVVTTDAGIVRMPVVMLENVRDLEGAALLLASLLGDDAMPALAEAVPHAYALAAPDAAEHILLAAIAFQLVAAAPAIAAGTLEDTDAGTTALNVPPEAHAMLSKVGLDAFLLFFPLALGWTGVGGDYDGTGVYSEDWVDRPEVFVWTVRKSGPGVDVWKGTYLERTGSSNGATAGDFEGVKRVESGLALRSNGVVTHVAGVYEETRVARAYDGTSFSADVRYTVGATAADAADAPLASIEMEQTRADASGQVELYPDEQQEDWRVGVHTPDGFVPLLGARTSVRHDIHQDVTNLGESVLAYETERVSSVGAYVGGDYVPLVGARYYGERVPAELYALAFVGNGLLGDQRSGDVEISSGAFVQGEYTPALGMRIDDDFLHHLYDHRTMVSAGTYALGAYQPLVGTTWDGERTLLAWAPAHALGGAEGDTQWQTSVGTYTLAFYRPVFGSRFEPSTQAAERAEQESYQLGVYPLNYDPFIPLVALEYDGDEASGAWALSLAGGAAGGAREGTWDADLVAFTPGPFAFPLAGVQYRTSAPDQDGAYDTHVAIGAYDGATFTPLLGATISMDDAPVGFALGQLDDSSEARVSVGHYVGGSYAPLGTVDTAALPPPPV